MTIKQIIAPALEPVSLGEMKEALRLLHSSQDTLISGLIVAARQRAESFTRRAFITSTWDATWSRFPVCGRYISRFSGRVLELPRSNLLTVVSLKHMDTDGAIQTMDPSEYTVDVDSVPGRLVLNPDCSWPDLGDYPNAVRIRFTAGYGAAATDVPETAKLAIKFLVAHWFANPAPVNVGNITSALPDHVNSLLNMLRVEGFGSVDEEQIVTGGHA